MMRNLICLIQILILTNSCDLHCNECFANNNPYACTSCNSDMQLFISSCQFKKIQINSLQIIVCIIVLLLYFFMILLGYGVYRDCFINIQLASLLNWSYGTQNTRILQASNLAIYTSNSFSRSYSIQFILSFLILLFFCTLILIIDKIPHDETVILLHRKNIIFPVRLFMFTITFEIFTSFTQLFTLQLNNIQILDFILAILVLGKIILIIVWLIIICNEQKFSIQNPNYYVLIEKICSSKYYVRNIILISILRIILILIIFISLYSKPQISGIIILIINGLYIIYTMNIKYIKLRYFLGNILSNILLQIIIFCIYFCTRYQISSHLWQLFKFIYQILLLLLCLLFCILQSIQIVAKRFEIMEEIKSIFYRFVLCKQNEKAIQMHKWDENNHRQQVIIFNTNELYLKNLN